MSASWRLARAGGPASLAIGLPPLKLHPRLARLAVLAIIVAAGAVLRFCWIADQPFWRNELFSVFWVRNSWLFLWTQGMRLETNPPLYYSLLKLWISGFGESELAVRSLSALASTICIPLVYLLTCELGEKRAAFPAAAVLAVAPAQIYFANETRGYALIPTLFAAVLLCVFRYLRTAGVPSVSGGLSLVGCALASTALVYVHVSSILLLVSVGAAFALFAFDGGLDRRVLVPLAVVTAVTALLAVPEALMALLQHDSPNIEWIPALSLPLVAGVVRLPVLGPIPTWESSHYTYDPAIWWQAGLSLALFAVLVVAARLSAAKPANAMLLALMPVLFLLIGVAASAIRPVLLPRLLIFGSVPLSILAGIAIAGPADRRLRSGSIWSLAIATLVFGCSVAGIANSTVYPAQPKPAWRQLIPELAARVAPGDVIIAGPHADPLALAFYGDGLPPGLDLRRWVISAQPETAASRLDDSICGNCAIGSDELAALIRQGRPVWLALDAADQAVWEQKKLAQRFPAPAEVMGLPSLRLLGWNPAPRALGAR